MTAEVTLVAVIPPAIRRRWDATAVDQLCAELARQAEEIERLRHHTEDSAEF